MSATLLGLVLLVVLWLCSKLLSSSRSVKTTKLKGPPSPSWFLGLTQFIAQTRAADADREMSDVYEDWAAQYGPVYQFPVALGRNKIVLTDPKAVVHFYSSERAVYVKTENDRLFIGKIFGRGVLWAEGEMHKRQRKALTPAFSNAAIRRLTDVFFDSAHKLKSFWDATLENSTDGSAIIEVQEWMNRVALDSIGIAGFSHDFAYLEGKSSPVTRAFEALQTIPSSIIADLVFVISATFPFVLNLPTDRMRLFWELRRSLNVIAERLLESTRREKEGGVAEEFTDKSIIGLLLKSEMATAELHMTQEEIVAQNVLLLAGYETTSVSLTWALLELARRPEMQDKLRQELLSKFPTSDPTWDQLVSTSELPYLDAVVQETLRTHPPVAETPRIAGCDDVIPLGTPIVDASGQTITSLTIAKGTALVAPIRAINRSEALWGPQAKEFIPERWLSDIDVPAKDLQGHRHLLTFHDGPRTCLGKAFALCTCRLGRLSDFELSCSLYSGIQGTPQSVLSVLIRNYIFELPDPAVKIQTHVAIVPRPKVAGESGARVPMRVRRVE
ncbi:Cytochrome P450 [Mycena chlorophos]|uniref:Cytochrome P450 n=1 Tax=Mycena chlorophos TaxID=658473 RepID=A0A8H6TJ77_MYCCL|nr:Cytochrome P450 [Mycena chlorophos]